MEHEVLQLLVGVDAFEARQRRDRDELRRRGECGDHREVVELHDAGAGVQDAGGDRSLRRLRFIEVDDVDRRVAWNCWSPGVDMYPIRDWAHLHRHFDETQTTEVRSPPAS